MNAIRDDLISAARFMIDDRYALTDDECFRLALVLAELSGMVAAAAQWTETVEPPKREMTRGDIHETCGPEVIDDSFKALAIDLAKAVKTPPADEKVRLCIAEEVANMLWESGAWGGLPGHLSELSRRIVAFVEQELPPAQGIEARQGGDADAAPSSDESPVRKDAPKYTMTTSRPRP